MTGLLRGKPSFLLLAASVKPGGTPGKGFSYQSINSEVLGLVLERATGMPLSKYVEKKLWQYMGAEHDAYFFRHEDQPHVPAAGSFNAALRDYALFGLIILKGGQFKGRRIIPESWIAETTDQRNASLKPRPPGAREAYSDNLGYGNHWWLPHGEQHAVYALGIYGQVLYINFRRETVVVITSAWDKPDPSTPWNELLKVVEEVARKVHPLPGEKQTATNVPHDTRETIQISSSLRRGFFAQADGIDK